jgi:hypothetical protein
MPWVHSTFNEDDGGKDSARLSKPWNVPASSALGFSTTGVA